VIPAVLNPPHKYDVLANVAFSQLNASVGAFHISK